MKIDNDRNVAPFRRPHGNMDNGGPFTSAILHRDHVIADREKSAIC
jgi:hypothetical protein